MRRLALVTFVALWFAPLASHAQDVDHPLTVGGDVKPPIITWQADPAFSHITMPHKVSPSFVISLVVDEQGKAQKVAMVRGIGKEIDRHVIEAVQQYRFKPAMRNGKPVAVKLNIEIDIDTF